MRKIWIALIVLLWCVAGFQIVQGRAASWEYKITDAFHTVGNGEKTSVVEYYGTYDEGYLPVENREGLLKDVARQLGILSGTEMKRSYEDARQEVVLTKQARYAKTTLRFVTAGDGEETKQYIIANITLNKDIDSALVHKKKLSEVLERCTTDGRSSANVIGCYDGRLSLEARNEKADEILGQLGGRVVEEHREMQLYTIYAYTSYIADYIMQEDQAVNVNIAMRYQESEDKTYVYVAIPILGLDY